MRTVVRVRQTGGPDALLVEQDVVPSPGPGEVLLEHHAIGLNFIDVYLRSGLYPTPLPFIAGQEGAGTVLEVGPGVDSLREGDRVAYAGVTGAYATHVVVPAARLAVVPAHLDLERAAAVMLKGLTAEYLVRRCHRIEPGQVVVVHAAAGGVGQLVCQWASKLGATVIAVVGSAGKVDFARRAGSRHVVCLASQNLVEEVKQLTDGRGADVVYDSVGKDTLPASLDALRSRGLLVSFGQSSGMPAPIALASLGGARSLYVTRPSLHAWVHERAELLEAAAQLFGAIERGVLTIPPPTTFPLTRVAEAHRALEARQTTGAVVLLPDGQTASA